MRDIRNKLLLLLLLLLIYHEKSVQIPFMGTLCFRPFCKKRILGHNF